MVAGEEEAKKQRTRAGAPPKRVEEVVAGASLLPTNMMAGASLLPTNMVAGVVKTARLSPQKKLMAVEEIVEEVKV